MHSDVQLARVGGAHQVTPGGHFFQVVLRGVDHPTNQRLGVREGENLPVSAKEHRLISDVGAQRVDVLAVEAHAYRIDTLGSPGGGVIRIGGAIGSGGVLLLLFRSRGSLGLLLLGHLI